MNAFCCVAPPQINGKILKQDADKMQAFNNYFRSVFTAPTDIKISP